MTVLSKTPSRRVKFTIGIFANVALRIVASVRSTPRMRVRSFKRPQRMHLLREHRTDRQEEDEGQGETPKGGGR